MEPISSMTAGAAFPLPAVSGAAAARRAERPGEDGRDNPARPDRDEYIPGEPPQAAGRYWPERDGDGQPRIRSDGPAQDVDGPERGESPESSESPERPEGSEKNAPSRKGEKCVGDTGRVDREIEALKRRRDTLEQRAATETDEAKLQALERELAQVEGELRRKDNGTYRRQHTVFH